MPCATISTHCLIGGLNVSRRNKSRPAGGIEKPITATLDAFSNQLFSLGYGSQSPLEATEYPLTRMTDNYALLNSLYRSNWVVQNVVGLMVDDMLREWYDLKSTTGARKGDSGRGAFHPAPGPCEHWPEMGPPVWRCRRAYPH